MTKETYYMRQKKATVRDKRDLLYRKILEEELESTGIRLNRTPPDIYFKKKKTGGIKFNSMVPLTKIGSDPASVVHKVLQVFFFERFFFQKNSITHTALSCF